MTTAWRAVPGLDTPVDRDVSSVTVTIKFGDFNQSVCVSAIIEYSAARRIGTDCFAVFPIADISAARTASSSEY